VTVWQEARSHRLAAQEPFRDMLAFPRAFASPPWWHRTFRSAPCFPLWTLGAAGDFLFLAVFLEGFPAPEGCGRISPSRCASLVRRAAGRWSDPGGLHAGGPRAGRSDLASRCGHTATLAALTTTWTAPARRLLLPGAWPSLCGRAVGGSTTWSHIAPKRVWDRRLRRPARTGCRPPTRPAITTTFSAAQPTVPPQSRALAAAAHRAYVAWRRLLQDLPVVARRP